MRYPNLDNGLFLFIVGWISLLPLIFYISQQISSYYYLLLKLDIVDLFIFLSYDICAGALFATPYFIYNLFIQNYRGGIRVPQNRARVLKRRDEL